MIALKFTNEQLTIAGLVVAVGGWYAFTKLSKVAEAVIDETVDAAAAAVDVSKEVSRLPFDLTSYEFYGEAGDSSTFGSRGWLSDTWGDLWTSDADQAAAKAKAKAEAPDVYFNDSDIPQVLP